MQVLQQFAEARKRILAIQAHNAQLDDQSELGRTRLNMMREGCAVVARTKPRKTLRKRG